MGTFYAPFHPVRQEGNPVGLTGRGAGAWSDGVMSWWLSEVRHRHQGKPRQDGSRWCLAMWLQDQVVKNCVIIHHIYIYTHIHTYACTYIHICMGCWSQLVTVDPWDFMMGKKDMIPDLGRLFSSGWEEPIRNNLGAWGQACLTCCADTLEFNSQSTGNQEFQAERKTSLSNDLWKDSWAGGRTWKFPKAGAWQTLTGRSVEQYNTPRK